MENTPRLNLVIDVLMLAGAILAQSGAEIHRVEDTMIRIAHSQGIEQANVLADSCCNLFLHLIIQTFLV